MNIYIYDDTVTDESNRLADAGRSRAIRDQIFTLKTQGLLGEGAIVSKQVFSGSISECSVAAGFGNDCIDCTKAIEFHVLADSFTLFIHTSNKCFYRYVKKYLNAEKCWLVCYSGSDKADSYDAIKKYAMEQSVPIKNLAFSPHIGPDISSASLSTKWNLKAFIEAVMQNKSNPFDYLIPKAKMHIINLYPLCLGYLDAHSNTAINKETTESESWWKGVLGDNLQGDRLKDELRELKEDEKEKLVNELIETINGVKTATIDNKEKAVDALTLNVTKLKGLCHKLETSGRLL